MTNAAVEGSTFSGPEVEQCVLARVKGWAFPRSTDGKPVSVTLSMSFH